MPTAEASKVNTIGPGEYLVCVMDGWGFTAPDTVWASVVDCICGDVGVDMFFCSFRCTQLRVVPRLWETITLFFKLIHKFLINPYLFVHSLRLHRFLGVM